VGARVPFPPSGGGGAAGAHLKEDVRERTRELREAQTDLMRAERLAALGQLAGGVAHEMRTPLSVIRNAVHYLEMDVDRSEDEEFPAVLDEMKRAIASTDHIITEMLDYVREPPGNRAEFSIGEAIEDALEPLEIPETIRLERRGDLEVSVSASRDQVTRILDNLLQNAIQAMPEGGELGVRVDVDGEAVVVEVRDTGSGISRDNLERVFDPLFTTKTRGIGLGLAIAHRYAELNRGRLEVESEAGVGSRFRVVLPAADGGERRGRA